MNKRQKKKLKKRTVWFFSFNEHWSRVVPWKVIKEKGRQLKFEGRIK